MGFTSASGHSCLGSRGALSTKFVFHCSCSWSRMLCVLYPGVRRSVLRLFFRPSGLPFEFFSNGIRFSVCADDCYLLIVSHQIGEWKNEKTTVFQHYTPSTLLQFRSPRMCAVFASLSISQLRGLLPLYLWFWLVRVYFWFSFLASLKNLWSINFTENGECRFVMCWSALNCICVDALFSFSRSPRTPLTMFVTALRVIRRDLQSGEIMFYRTMRLIL